MFSVSLEGLSAELLLSLLTHFHSYLPSLSPAHTLTHYHRFLGSSFSSFSENLIWIFTFFFSYLSCRPKIVLGPVGPSRLVAQSQICFLFVQS